MKKLYVPETEESKFFFVSDLIKFFQAIDIYSEVLKDAVLDLIDLGKVRAASFKSVLVRGTKLKEVYKLKCSFSENLC